MQIGPLSLVYSTEQSGPVASSIGSSCFSNAMLQQAAMAMLRSRMLFANMHCAQWHDSPASKAVTQVGTVQYDVEALMAISNNPDSGATTCRPAWMHGPVLARNTADLSLSCTLVLAFLQCFQITAALRNWYMAGSWADCQLDVAAHVIIGKATPAPMECTL